MEIQKVFEEEPNTFETYLAIRVGQSLSEGLDFFFFGISQEVARLVAYTPETGIVTKSYSAEEAVNLWEQEIVMFAGAVENHIDSSAEYSSHPDCVFIRVAENGITQDYNLVVSGYGERPAIDPWLEATQFFSNQIEFTDPLIPPGDPRIRQLPTRPTSERFLKNVARDVFFEIRSVSR